MAWPPSFFPNGGTLAVQALYYGGTLQRFRYPDWQGSIRAESDPVARAFTESLAFAPFGERYALKGAPFNVDSFTGKPDQLVSDEYDFPAREEHNGQDRWLSPDPMRGTGNKYVYADNNPLSNVDLYGLFPSNEGVDYTGDDGISSDPSSEPLYQQESHPSVPAQTSGQIGQAAPQKKDPCETAFCLKVNVWGKTWSDAARTYWQHFLDQTSPEAFGRMGNRYAQFHLRWDRFWARQDCGGGNGPCGIMGPSLAELGLYVPPTKTLFRAVDRTEFESIQKTGKFAQSPGGAEYKYFYPTLEQAETMGERLYPGNYGIVSGTFPENVVEGPTPVFTEGDIFVVPVEKLDMATPKVEMPIGEVPE